MNTGHSSGAHKHGFNITARCCAVSPCGVACRQLFASTLDESHFIRKDNISACCVELLFVVSWQSKVEGFLLK